MKSTTADSQFGVAGYSLPYGAQLTQGGVEFSFASKTATGARVLLYSSPSDTEPDRVISLDMERDRLGGGLYNNMLWKRSKKELSIISNLTVRLRPNKASTLTVGRR